MRRKHDPIFLGQGSITGMTEMAHGARGSRLVGPCHPTALSDWLALMAACPRGLDTSAP